MPKFLKKSYLNTLAASIQKGNPHAATAMFGYFNPLFFGHFIKKVMNRDVAEDLTQDVFLRILKNIQHFNESAGDFSAWVWRIAKNRLIDYYREKKTISFFDLETIQTLTDENENLSEKIMVEKIYRLVKKLHPKEQQLFTLRFVLGLSYKEMVKTTHKSETSLRVAVHRIKNKLKKIIHG